MTISSARTIIHIQAKQGGHSKEKVKFAMDLLKTKKVIPKWSSSAEQAHNFLMMR